MIRASVTHLLLMAVFMRGHQLVHMNLAGKRYEREGHRFYITATSASVYH